MVIQEVKTQTNVRWNMNFSAPNEVAGASDIKTSIRSDFTPEMTCSSSRDALYAGIYREDKGSSQSMNSFLMYNNNGSVWNASTSTSNIGSTQCDRTFYIGQGRVLGTCLFAYNVTNIRTVAPQVRGLSVGLRTKSFSVTRRTMVVAYSVSPRQYDTNNAGQNSTPINITLEWRDAIDNTLITSADGVPVTANITLTSGTRTGCRLQAAHPENLVPSWENRTMANPSAGRYEAYPLRDLSGGLPIDYGNITQGYKNFTIILRKDGTRVRQSRTISPSSWIPT